MFVQKNKQGEWFLKNRKILDGVRREVIVSKNNFEQTFTIIFAYGGNPTNQWAHNYRPEFKLEITFDNDGEFVSACFLPHDSHNSLNHLPMEPKHQKLIELVMQTPLEIKELFTPIECNYWTND